MKHKRSAWSWSLLYHIGFGLLLVIPLNLLLLVIYHEISDIEGRVDPYYVGETGGVFFAVDRIVSGFGINTNKVVQTTDINRRRTAFCAAGTWHGVPVFNPQRLIRKNKGKQTHHRVFRKWNCFLYRFGS